MLREQNVITKEIKGLGVEISMETARKYFAGNTDVLLVTEDTSVQYVGYAVKL